MNITLYSFIMSVIWCNSFILLSILCTRWNRFVRYNISSVIILIFVSCFRLIFTFEFPVTTIVRSERIYPVINDFLENDFAYIEFLNTNVSFIKLFVSIWLVVGTGLLVRYISRFKKNARERAMLPIYRDIQSEVILLGIVTDRDKNKIHVYRDPVKTPLLHGIVKPRIYLPEYDFNKDELIRILMHEYNHYLHKDILVIILINCFCILFWWNPMVYLLKANLNHALEVKCDISLICDLSEESRISYLDSIMRIVMLSKGSNSRLADGSACLVSIEGKKLEQRIEIVLGYAKPNWKSKLSNILFFSVMASLLVVSFLFILQPHIGRLSPTDAVGIFDQNSVSDGLIYKGSELTSYLVMNEDGTYSLYIGKEFNMIIYELSDSLENLPIIKNQEE